MRDPYTDPRWNPVSMASSGLVLFSATYGKSPLPYYLIRHYRIENHLHPEAQRELSRMMINAALEVHHEAALSRMRTICSLSPGKVGTISTRPTFDQFLRTSYVIPPDYADKAIDPDPDLPVGGWSDGIDRGKWETPVFKSARARAVDKSDKGS